MSLRAFALSLLTLLSIGCDDDEDGYRAPEDCNDSDSTIYPGAPEDCDGVDSNCDGTVEYSLTVWLDSDGDTFGDPNQSSVVCESFSLSGYVTNALDCNDRDFEVHPDAEEVCDGFDNDCDGIEDDLTTFWIDADGDGYGDASHSGVELCEETVDYVLDNSDCDDTNPMVHLEATELCDGVDNDCDGLVDQADDPSLSVTCYLDADGDGWGGSTTVTACGACDPGYVAVGGDCDDDNAARYPGAVDLEGDGIDSDCDSQDCTVAADGMTDHYLCRYSGNADGAFAVCSDDMGGRPSTFVDEGEYTVFVDMMKLSAQPFVLVGLTDRDSEGTWQTLDGDPAPYLPWSSGNPNDSNGDEDCAAIQSAYDYLLNDVPCTSFEFSGVTFACDRDLPEDLKELEGYDTMTFGSSCTVTWLTIGSLADSPPEDCPSCPLIFEVLGSVVAHTRDGTDACDDLARSRTYYYSLTFDEGGRLSQVYGSEGFLPRPNAWDEYATSTRLSESNEELDAFFDIEDSYEGVDYQLSSYMHLR